MLKPPTSPLRFTQTFHAAAIGHKAAEVTAAPATGRVTGSTSRGVFILVPEQRVIFLSYEPHRGPQTVNLDPPPAQALPVFQGQEVNLAPDEIGLPELNAHILIDRRLTWRPPAPPEPLRPAGELAAALRSLARRVIETRRGAGLVPLLPFILDLPARPTVPISLQPTISAVLLLKQNLLTRPLEASLPQVKELMGLGRGLTPSGDDLITGLLLIFNRIPLRQDIRAQLPAFAQQIIELAYAKTTSLSANLIEAAVQGSADERLLTAADGLLGGALSEAQILASLEAYGSSSGFDAFAGMALLIEALRAAA